MKQKFFLFALAFCCALSFVSCGGDDDDNLPEKGNDGEVGPTLVVQPSTETGTYDGEGLFFKINSEDEKTVALIDLLTYHEDLVIPSYIECYGQKFTVTEIGNDACKDSWITSVKIPNTIKKIGYCAFQGSSLKSIEIPNSVTEIMGGVCRDCWNLESFKLPKNIKKISYSMFRNCTSLKTIEIPNTVTEIEEGAFNGCKGLTTLTFPNSVKVIGYEAFAYCTNLQTVELGESVSFIKSRAFVDAGINKFICLSSNPPGIDGDPFDYGTKSKGSLIVPNSAIEAYKNANVWKEFENIVGF